MSQAESAVSSAVGRMLGQLQRLNTTVTARVRVETESVPTPGSLTPNFAPSNFAPAAFSLTSTFDAPAMSRTLEAQAEAAQMSAAGFRTAIATALRDERKKSDNEPQVVKNYYFTITAAPNVPTEKQIVKQLRFADSLYGE
jgi:hypothetical protein